MCGARVLTCPSTGAFSGGSAILVDEVSRRACLASFVRRVCLLWAMDTGDQGEVMVSINPAFGGRRCK